MIRFISVILLSLTLLFACGSDEQVKEKQKTEINSELQAKSFLSSIFNLGLLCKKDTKSTDTEKLEKSIFTSSFGFEFLLNLLCSVLGDKPDPTPNPTPEPVPTPTPIPNPIPTPVPTPTEPKPGVIGVDANGQPTINGITTKTSCNPTYPAEACTKHCTVVVDGNDSGRYVGDTNGSNYDLPTIRFSKKGDKYCGGTGGICSVQIACRESKHNMFVTFKNPGAPASGEADRDGPYRYHTSGWLPGGYSYGFSWKSAGNDGKLVILLGGHLQRDGMD